MLNDLLNDPRVQDRFQFWFFSYSTGSPIPYSAMLLRDALAEAVAQLDPEGTDPALREMVVVGHSQGGLLVKMTAVDPGTRIWDAISRSPIDDLHVTERTRELLARALLVRPLPFVRRVIFIATPHGGSGLTFTTALVTGWLAGFVTLPVDVLGATADLLEGNSDALLVDPRGPRFGSVYTMRPGGPFLEALAATPIAPGIAAHSIIPVRGAGARASTAPSRSWSSRSPDTRYRATRSPSRRCGASCSSTPRGSVRHPVSRAACRAPPGAGRRPRREARREALGRARPGRHGHRTGLQR
jgi:hypothetical protein